MLYRGEWKMHFQRKGPFIEWWVYHSGYGSAGGHSLTRGGARRSALWAIGDFVQGVLDDVD